MIEVEIRSRVRNLKDIEKKLKEIGAIFKKTEEQSDFVFGNKSFLDSKNMVIEGGLIARIRTIDSDSYLEFKEINRKSGGFETSSKILNVNEGKSFLGKLNFIESFSIEKRRKIYLFGKFTICLDEVKGLGNFLEVEKLISDPALKSEAKKECSSLLKKIDSSLLSEGRKYGDLMQEKINGN